jgi:putative addiction module killer protein
VRRSCTADGRRRRCGSRPSAHGRERARANSRYIVPHRLQWRHVQSSAPPQFDEWLDEVRDPIASAAINVRIERAKLGNLGYWRAVGEGICEMKIDVGLGYRAYFVRRGKIIVVLLCGGDKSTQKKDIKLAKKLAGELED